MKKLSLTLSRKTLLKTQFRLCRHMQTVQYRVALVISGAFKGISPDRLYKELGLEYLAQKEMVSKIIFLP